jgi:hypothetical protein
MVAAAPISGPVHAPATIAPITTASTFDADALPPDFNPNGRTVRLN